jgi:hypothetical protein
MNRETKMPGRLGRHTRRTTEESSDILDRHNEEEEMYFRGQAFHRAAKVVVNALGSGQAPWINSDTMPILFLYREAAELHLKAAILGYGSTFLSAKPVPARIHGTHSLRILAALACRRLEAVRWDQGFKSECIADVCDLRALISKLESLDTSLRAFRCSDRKRIVIGSLAVNRPGLRTTDGRRAGHPGFRADALAAMADIGGLNGNPDLELGDEPVQ